MNDEPSKEKVHGYEIKRSILFENDRGFALAENPNAPQPFVTWQFTEENGRRDYYWGHYTTHADMAAKEYEARITDYQRSYGVSKKTARPVVKKKPITEQLKEGAVQAEKKNVARSDPAKNTEKNR